MVAKILMVVISGLISGDFYYFKNIFHILIKFLIMIMCPMYNEGKDASYIVGRKRKLLKIYY